MVDVGWTEKKKSKSDCVGGGCWEQLDFRELSSW